MKRLRLTAPAQTDYAEAIVWYENQQAGLGREFEAEIEEMLMRILSQPTLFSKATPTVRKARTTRFKFGIFFTMEGEEIGVLAIYHPSRNPAALQRRF